MAVNYLKLAVTTLECTRDGEGPEMPLTALGLASVALVERVDLLLERAERVVVSLEKIADKLPPRMRTPAEREAHLKALGYTFVDLERGLPIAPD